MSTIGFSLGRMLVTLGVLVLTAGTAGAADPPAKKLFGAKKDAASLSPRAIGSYARGCLSGGQALPVSGHGWEAMKLWRNRNWGHPVLINFLQKFANDVREKDGWPGLLIGDLAQPRGGPMLTGHRSHQIGLDADIWYRPKPEGKLSKKERADSWSIPLAKEFGRDVIKKNWKPGYVKVIGRAASHPAVARIFVHPAVKKALCEGATGDRSWLRKVRPWWKHNYHFHVRLRCPVGYAGCKDQKPPPEGEGCGAQLDDWMKTLAKAEAWSKKPKKPKKPGKKPARKELRVADLPQACQDVLNAGGAPRRQGAAPPAVSAKRAAATGGAALPWLASPAIPLPARKPR